MMASATFSITPQKIRNRGLFGTGNVFWKETKYEFMKRWRMRTYSVSTLLFPAMFYALFALILNTNVASRTLAATYLLPTMSCYGVMGVALYAFGVGVAVERGQGWLELKRASPMPPAAYLTARVLTCMLFSVIVAGLLLALGIAFGGVRLSVLHIVALLLTLTLSSVPFCAFGLVLGYLAKPNSAMAIVNIFYLPLSFLSGLWMPIGMLPHFLRKFALVLPPYHMGQLALQATGLDASGSVWLHIGVLVLFASLCVAVSGVILRRDEGQLYG
jgi:ABC-2 type transport system permease protein